MIKFVECVLECGDVFVHSIKTCTKDGSVGSVSCRGVLESMVFVLPISQCTHFYTDPSLVLTL